MKRDYYEILGVEPDATVEIIKTSYRKMALKFHPDRNPDDADAEDRFKECAEAYEVLHDQEKRQLYDAYGHDGLRNTGFQGFSGAQDIFSHFSDIFGDVFGFGGGGGRRPRRGNDLRYDIEVSLEEAARGKEVTIDVERDVACESCQGKGQRDGGEPEVCRTCNGQGQVMRSQGFFRLATTCPACHGAGRMVTDPCPDCNGSGTNSESKDLSIKVPAGIEHGQKMRMTGEGEGGPYGAPPGDLYLFVHVAAHGTFERHGDELARRLEVSMSQAALGATVMIDTLIDDVVEAKIPSGAETGAMIRLPGLGMPRLRGSRRGDMLVQLLVRTPKKMSKRQKELLADFAQMGDFGAAPTPHDDVAAGATAARGKKAKKKGFFKSMTGDN